MRRRNRLLGVASYRSGTRHALSSRKEIIPEYVPSGTSRTHTRRTRSKAEAALEDSSGPRDHGDGPRQDGRRRRGHRRQLQARSPDGRRARGARTSRSSSRQLERAMWRHIPKSVPTQTLTGDERPRHLARRHLRDRRRARSAVEDGWRPGFVMVDEAHHVGEDGTSRPARRARRRPGARRDRDAMARGRVRHHRALRRARLHDGHRRRHGGGYLAQVDYRLFVDNIDWDAVAEASEKGLRSRSSTSSCSCRSATRR